MSNPINSFVSRYNPTEYKNNDSLSSQIKAKLSLLAANNGKNSFIENQGNPIEIYHYGNESARLIKRLQDACVGEDGGKIGYFAEYSDYNRFNWWQTVLEKLPVSFLAIPVDDLAVDAQNSDPQLYFSPKKIIQQYHLNPDHDTDKEIACIQWVQDQVINTLNPLLAPDFKVIFLEDHFRLIPLTSEATLSDHLFYDKAKDAVLNALEPLQKSYQVMSTKLLENSKDTTHPPSGIKDG